MATEPRNDDGPLCGDQECSPSGGLISFRRNHDGRLVVNVYRCDPEVDVVVSPAVS